MDMKLFASTFAAIFLAELGDKTQLAVLTLSSQTSARWTIFLASALALAATSALGVLGGDLVAKLASPLLLKRLAGGAFILMGAWFLWTAQEAAVFRR
jgi:putative Ca2+/H+ antiporter (TMEM165/GDT1 family)